MTPLGLWVAAVVLFAPAVEQSGYLTGAPINDWLGLATTGGRDAIVLGEGCESAKAGANVIVLDWDHLQIVDPFTGPGQATCTLARRVHMSDVPCARDPLDLCDVAFE